MGNLPSVYLVELKRISGFLTACDRIGCSTAPNRTLARCREFQAADGGQCTCLLFSTWQTPFHPQQIHRERARYPSGGL